MIDVKTLRTLLKIEGIDTDDLSDEDLSVLIDSKVSELEGLTGLDILPKYRTFFKSRFKNDKLILNFYPIIEVNRICFKDKCLGFKHYHVDYDLGVIYFDKRLFGKIYVEYLSGLNDDLINILINPLIKDMIAYTLTFNRWGMGDVVSSIKEGDVSVNYDTNNGRGAKIMNRINDLRNNYKGTKLKWI